MGLQILISKTILKTLLNNELWHPVCCLLNISSVVIQQALLIKAIKKAVEPLTSVLIVRSSNQIHPD